MNDLLKWARFLSVKKLKLSTQADDSAPSTDDESKYC